MYLPKFPLSNIFVSGIKNEEELRSKRQRFTLVFGFCLLTVINFGQTMRPGDIMNDGFVNNIDALFWAEAYGHTGTPRNNPSSAFEDIQQLPIPGWDQQFYNDISYAHADCNGDGIVDELDLEQGIIDNLFKIAPGGFPFIPNQNMEPGSPTVKISSDNNQVMGGQTVEFDLSIEDDEIIEDFLGVIFTLKYNPNQIVDGSIQFTPHPGNWLEAGSGFEYFAIEQSGSADGLPPGQQQTQVAIVRKGETADGIGSIGKFSIVMEDIVILLTQVDISVETVVMVGPSLSPFIAEGSTLSFNNQGAATSTEELPISEKIRTYPNPIKDVLRVEIEDQAAQLLEVAVLNADGKELFKQDFKSQFISSVDLDWSKYASGLYFLKITTSEGIEVRRLTK